MVAQAMTWLSTLELDREFLLKIKYFVSIKVKHSLANYDLLGTKFKLAKL